MMDYVFLYLAVVIGQRVFECILKNGVYVCFQLFALYADGKFGTEIIDIILKIYFIGKGLGKVSVNGACYPGGGKF